MSVPLSQGQGWRPFLLSLAITVASTLGLALGFVWAVDPYGLRAGGGREPTPLMDLNGRFMFPQLARSGRFDSAVFGTSTIRLLEPAALGREFGGRYANLGLNAGTPWEQVELAKLFLRHTPAPRTLVFGLDRTWCSPSADVDRVTFRSFPAWLYDDSPLNDLPELLSLRSLEIAGRVVLHRLGLMPPRIRADGYERFTPPDSEYDLARARFHLRSGAPPASEAGQAARPAQTRFPALPWLDELLGRVPEGTRTMLVFPPIHIAAQAPPGSDEDAADKACKAAIAAVARRRGSLLLDLRVPSPVTREDSNYWDKLHFREAIASRLVAALAEASRTGHDSPDGFYRIMSPLQ